MNTSLKEYFGEFSGTFIIVLFGCGSVGGAVFLGAFGSLLEVAIIWGLAVALAIFISRNLCPAHLNPAVSLAMVLEGDLSFKKFPLYVLSQFLGAFVAAFVLYFLFSGTIENYETLNGISRGTKESMVSASMFGEFFPNPGFSDQIQIGHLGAFGAEAFGTFLLVLSIFKITEKKEQDDNLVPLMIGFTVTLIICLIAPFTQAGLNPARDFAPRLVACVMGWGKAAFPSPDFSFFTVYILAPCLAAVTAQRVHGFSKES